jgi:hypothetical protein
MSSIDSQHDPSNSSLYDYVYAKLLGSSLQIVRVSENEFRIEAGDIVSLDVKNSDGEKKIDLLLSSKILNREVTVEEIGGTLFMEARLEEELEKENRLIIEEDILLAIDIIQLWGKQNDGYRISFNGVPQKLKEEQEQQQREKGEGEEPDGKKGKEGPAAKKSSPAPRPPSKKRAASSRNQG